jgi:hypothetical protein
MGGDSLGTSQTHTLISLIYFYFSQTFFWQPHQTINISVTSTLTSLISIDLHASYSCLLAGCAWKRWRRRPTPSKERFGKNLCSIPSRLSTPGSQPVINGISLHLLHSVSLQRLDDPQPSLYTPAWTRPRPLLQALLWSLLTTSFDGAQTQPHPCTRTPHPEPAGRRPGRRQSSVFFSNTSQADMTSPWHRLPKDFRPPARVQNALQSADTLRHRPSHPITGHQSLLLALRTSSPLRATPCWIKRCRAPRTLSLRHSTPPSPTTHPRNGGAASHSLCTRWSSHSFSAPTGTS